MSAVSATARVRPGRPSTGARERIRNGALDVLKREGYAGLTTAKVAAASGQNKGLIAYHFGSKQGLVAAVARQVSDVLVAEVLEEVGEPTSAEELVRGLTAGVWRVIDADPGIQRVYFDLASQSVIDPEVSAIMAETKVIFRATLSELMRGLADGPPEAEREAIAVLLVAGVEGLALEHLDSGASSAIDRARRLFERSAAAVVRGDSS
jgi:TetR/AcrR family transcriptional regulator, transcriptional repressor of bet genes